VFDGSTFVKRPLVIENGRIIAADPSTAERRYDMTGAYLVPPFCEAHNHNLGSADDNQETIDRYLAEGIFYVGVLSNLPALTAPVMDTYNRPNSVDAIFLNGGLTATGGHPIRLRESLLERGLYPGFTRASLADHSYFVVDSAAELERKWPMIVGFKPDAIKIFLLWSEEFQRRQRDTSYFGQKGLDPALVPLIVDRAHKEGLRVFAHVESAHDFHVAVNAGIDVIAHLPGNDAPARIDTADARTAAARGVRVITTAVLIERPARKRDTANYTAMRNAQIENLRLLRSEGVALAAGSDETRQTSRTEIDYLAGLGVFSNTELLELWGAACARTLFPQRQLGRLDPGFEASFLVLEADPVADFSATRRIRLRVKDGTAVGDSASAQSRPL
jgi:imidazolonepropionase-like amidohydrolase